VRIYLRRHAEWFTGEQKRTERKARPSRAGHRRTRLYRSCQRSKGPCYLQAQPLQAGSFGFLTVPVSVLLPEPELRRKESSVKLGESRKDKRDYLFRPPGFKIKHARKQAEFSRASFTMAQNKGGISTNGVRHIFS
jgi:hypothetical protein